MAKDMYIGPLFEGAYRYARSLNPDKIFILSGKYGLLEETDMIEPYDENLNIKPTDEIKKWAKNVLAKLSQKTDLQKDEFIFLAGNKYRKFLLESIRHSSIPIKGLTLEQQITFYSRKLDLPPLHA